MAIDAQTRPCRQHQGPRHSLGQSQGCPSALRGSPAVSEMRKVSEDLYVVQLPRKTTCDNPP